VQCSQCPCWSLSLYKVINYSVWKGLRGKRSKCEVSAHPYPCVLSEAGGHTGISDYTS
jgi:hypothetical protein